MLDDTPQSGRLAPSQNEQSALTSGDEVGPVMAEAPQPGSRLMPALVEILETLVFALLIFLVIQAIWRNFRVEGSSMEPNIHDGQYIIVDRVVYAQTWPVNFLRRTLGRSALGGKILDQVFHPPRRGDVIVFIPPNNPQKDYIKRVIGIAGDTVEMRQGRVFVNSQPLSEPYIRPGPASSFGPVIVKRGEVFVMGDNRGGSTDSRFFGALSMHHVIGKAWLSYWPPRYFGFIRHYDLDAQVEGQR